MDEEAFEQYHQESTNWLHKSRRDFLCCILRDVCKIESGVSILEIGAGVGQNTTALLQFGQVDAIEINESGIEALRSIPNIRKIITHPIPFNLGEFYDVIVAMDVLEHIQDDQTATKWIVDRLLPGGFVFLTAPAYQWFFSEHDLALCHFRRYTAKSIRNLLPFNLSILRSGYFNTILFPIAAITRFRSLFHYRRRIHTLDFKARKNSSVLPEVLDRLFRNILKLEITLISKGINPPFGLSVFCVAELPPNTNRDKILK